MKIKLLLDSALQGAIVNPQVVIDEIEHISNVIGRDFTQFLKETEEGLHIEAEEGAFSPRNWGRLPTYGSTPIHNPESKADSPEGFRLFFLSGSGSSPCRRFPIAIRS